MKLITTFALSFLVGSASSFAPVTTSTTTHNNHRVSPLNAVSQSELKGYYVYDADKDISDNIPSDWGFDPLGFSDTKGGMFFMREAEIKHARLAMLAVRVVWTDSLFSFFTTVNDRSPCSFQILFTPPIVA